MSEIDWSKHKVWSSAQIQAELGPIDRQWSITCTRAWSRKSLAYATYGIEIAGVSLMLETDWDNIASRINPRLGTNHPLIDEFFAARFSPMTTGWIHHHPELDRVAEGFGRYKLIVERGFDPTLPKYRDRLKQRV